MTEYDPAVNNGVESVDQRRATYEDFSMTVVKGGHPYVNVRNDSYGADSGSHIYSVEVDNGEAVSCSCPHHVHRGTHCKHQKIVESNPLVLSAAKGHNDTAVLTDGGKDDSETDDDSLPEITTHMEAPQYGGCEYVRCEGCQNESIGGEDRLLHKHDCPHNDDSETPKDYDHVEDNGRTEAADFGHGEGGIDVL